MREQPASSMLQSCTNHSNEVRYCNTIHLTAPRESVPPAVWFNFFRVLRTDCDSLWFGC